MAITSLVFGIAALPAICCYGIPAIALGVTAVILGRMSLGRIRESGGALGGYGLAQAGWITGLVGGSLGLIYTLITLGIVILTFVATANGIGIASPTP
ncbi:MAG TPA: hypothetical protein VND96_04305 [Candidatus Micrarchaeaceae archaeon]|nr:hypothetical protein [Candidatus Micrarchaeaceae archaeon]